MKKNIPKDPPTPAHMFTFMATPEMIMNSTTSSVAAAWSSRNCRTYGYTTANSKKMFDESADFGYAMHASKNTKNNSRTTVQ